MTDNALLSAAPQPLAKGDMIRDNDPRMAARGGYQVDFISNGRASACRSMGDCVWIAVTRIHLDGKPRRSGWSRIATNARKEPAP